MKKLMLKLCLGLWCSWSFGASEFTVNDPLFNQQWGLKNPLGYDVGASFAWERTRGDKRLAVVIIDTGIDYHHPDLLNNIWTNPLEIPNNHIDDDGNGYVDDIHGINAINDSGDPMDDEGHGTFMAGVIDAEANNGIGIAGVAHDVSLIACKFLDHNGSGSMRSALKCLDYVADLATRDIGVTIVATHNSWGGGPFSEVMLDAIKRQRDLGILFVTASGSETTSIDENKFYPAAYDVPNIVVTSSMNAHGQLANFSNFGPNTVHVAAPGVNIITTTLNGAYTNISGSVAAAFVSGTIVLIKAQSPQLTWAQIKHRLMVGVNKFSTVEDQNKIVSGGFVSAFNSL